MKRIGLSVILRSYRIKPPLPRGPTQTCVCRKQSRRWRNSAAPPQSHCSLPTKLNRNPQPRNYHEHHCHCVFFPPRGGCRSRI